MSAKAKLQLVALTILVFGLGVLLGYGRAEWAYEPYDVSPGPDFIAWHDRDSEAYDFRSTDAYRRLSQEDQMRLETVHRDLLLLWGALDKHAYEHDGLVPRSLEELVPGSLRELPRDPFAGEDGLAAAKSAGYQPSLGGRGYQYHPGAAGNRAWIVRSVGLPDFPYGSPDAKGLYVIRGEWLSGANLSLRKPTILYEKQ